jgi:hypothetical protein
MRNSILYSFLFISLTSSLLGCSKKHEVKTLPPSIEAQYMSAEQQLSKMLSDLNNLDVPLQRKRVILCKTYREVYKTQYMPALLKLSPHNYTEQSITRDYEAVISFYKKAFDVNCD